MNIDIIASILGAIISLIAGGLTASDLAQKLVHNLLKHKPLQKPYSERLTELTESLSNASREVDEILAELAQVAKERARDVQQLETELASMHGREKDLRDKIDVLEKTPLAVAEHFADLVAPGEKRSAMRDYLLFGAGVLVSTVIGIAIQLFLK